MASSEPTVKSLSADEEAHLRRGVEKFLDAVKGYLPDDFKFTFIARRDIDEYRNEGYVTTNDDRDAAARFLSSDKPSEDRVVEHRGFGEPGVAKVKKLPKTNALDLYLLRQASESLALAPPVIGKEAMPHVGTMLANVLKGEGLGPLDREVLAKYATETWGRGDDT